MIKKKDAVNCSFRLAVSVNQYWIRQRLPSPRYLTMWTIFDYAAPPLRDDTVNAVEKECIS